MQQSTRYDASDLVKLGYLPAEAPSPDHDRYEGRVRSTMRRIRRSTGSKIAQDIWDLFSEVLVLAALRSTTEERLRPLGKPISLNA